jgi:hypothetical protein
MATRYRIADVGNFKLIFIEGYHLAAVVDTDHYDEVEGWIDSGLVVYFFPKSAPMFSGKHPIGIPQQKWQQQMDKLQELLTPSEVRRVKRSQCFHKIPETRKHKFANWLRKSVDKLIDARDGVYGRDMFPL